MKNISANAKFFLAAIVFSCFVFAKNLQAQNPITQTPTYGCDDSVEIESCIHACTGDTITYTLADNSATQINWQIPIGGVIVSGANTQQVVVVWNTQGQYIVTASFLSGNYQKYAEQCVIVSGVTAVIGSNYAFLNGNCINVCKGSPVIFNNNSYSNIVSSEWDFGDGTPGAQTSGVASVTHTFNTQGTWTVILTVHSECCNDTAHYCVIVNPGTVPEISCITAICAGQQGVMYTGQPCTNYEWEVTGGTISGSTSSNPVSVDWGNGPEGTLSLLCHDFGACRVPTIVSVPIMPSGNFVINGQQNVCASCPNTYSYSAPYIPGAQYTWKLDGVIQPNLLQPYLQDFSFCSFGTHTLTCHMQNDVLDCMGDASIMINVIEDFHLTVDHDTICAGQTVNVFANLNSGPPLFCDWQINSGSGGSGLSVAFAPTISGTYTVTASPNPASAACSPSKSLTVVVLDAPAIAAINGPAIVCPGGTYSYSASVSSATAIVNWSLNDGNATTSGTGSTFTGIFPANFTNGTLTATATEGGCSSSTSINITAPALPQPLIIPDTFQVCVGQSITYSATLSYPGLSTVQWVINPTSAGTITSGQGTNTITVLWNGVGGNVTLEMNETTCLIQTGGDIIPITYFATPNITASAASVCNGVSGTLTASGGLTYQWFYPSGSPISGATNPTYSTYASGNYFVTGTDAHGCKANAYTQALQLPEPVVSIYGLESAACDPLTGMFTSPQTLTLSSCNGTIHWSDNSSNCSITVTQPGTYSATVTNAAGCTATQSFAISCYCPPATCPECVEGGSCTNGVFDGTPPILSAPMGTSYSWIPNGETTQTISAGTPGISYSVTVFDNTNTVCPSSVYSYYVYCSGETCPFSGGNATCTANAPTYNQVGQDCNTFSFAPNTTGICNAVSGWNFGDGTTGSGNTPTHTYAQAGTYQVCYGIVSSFLCELPIQACELVTVPVAANFSFIVNCNTGTFTDLSTSLGANITSWTWDFGDGTPLVFAQSPIHNFNVGGNYNVKLKIVAGDCQATITIPVTIQAPGVSISQLPPVCNGPVQLSATVNNGSTNIVDWDWNFNDPLVSHSNLQNPVHTFPAGGPYNVTLTVTDGYGCTATSNMSVTAAAPPPPFPLTGGTACGSLPVVTPNAGNYTSFQWSDNGSQINETSSQILVTSSGNYSVEVIDMNGCIIESTPAQVIINPLPPINLSVSPNPICSNDILTLHSGVSAAYTVKWVDINNPNSIFFGTDYEVGALAPGTYQYSCEVTDAATLCTSIDTITFTVGASPVILQTLVDPPVCAPNPVNIAVASGTPYVTFLWSNGATVNSIYVYTSGSYTVTVIDPANGCTASTALEATIYPLPDLTMLPIGCDSGCINPIADTIHGPPGMAMYEWQINGVPVSTLQNLGLNNINMPNYGVAYTIQLIATTVNGCADSTMFEYTPHSCDSSHCYTMTDTIWCNTDGTYSFQIEVQNNNATSGSSFWMHDFTMPFAVDDGNPFTSADMFYTFLYVPPGANSGWFPPVPLILSVPPGNAVPSAFCFKTLIIYGDTCCYDSLCITIPDCVPCDNISISSSSIDSTCCRSVSLHNNYNGGYFTGVQVTPVTTGATIGSTYLNGGFTGSWNTPTNNSSTVIYEPDLSNNGGFIPTGNTTDLFSMCLSLAPGTPSPQIVLVDWLTPDVNGADSIACTDTLKFYCISEPLNMCGTLEDTIICLGNGDYQYSFTLTNNSANAISMLAVDYMSVVQPYGFLTTFILNPPLAPGASITESFVFNTSLQAGTVICYHITLLDSIGCCCHAVDTVCFMLPDCEIDTCGCGSWTPLSIDLTTPDGNTTTYPDQTCGALFNNLPVGTIVNFSTGGYICNPSNESCVASISWSAPGATPSSGTGLPYFTLNNAGTYKLTLQATCGGNACAPCIYTFIVDNAEAQCDCGQWDPLSAVLTTPDGNQNGLAPVCGDVIQTVQGAQITFTGGDYHCSGDANCLATMTWSIPGATPSSGTGLPVFALGNAGGYELTMRVYCNGNSCDTCKIYLVADAVQECNCGNWTGFTGTYIGTDGNTNNISLGCGMVVLNVAANSLIDFTTGGYSCSGGENCLADLTWTVSGNAMPSSGTGLPSFTLLSGTCTVSIFSSCGNGSCGSCDIVFVGDEGCACNGWKPFKVSIGNLLLLNQSCGTPYGCFTKNTTIKIDGSYDCSQTDICSKTYNWLIKRNNNFFMSGSGMPIIFTATDEGAYLVTIYAYCDGLPCKACTFTFNTTPVPCNTPPVNLSNLNENELTGVGTVMQHLKMIIEPNPAKSSFNVKMQSGVEEDGQLILYNELGLVMKAQDAYLKVGDSGFTVLSDDLPAGTYYVRYTGHSQFAVSKVSIVR